MSAGSNYQRPDTSLFLRSRCRLLLCRPPEMPIERPRASVATRLRGLSSRSSSAAPCVTPTLTKLWARSQDMPASMMVPSANSSGTPSSGPWARTSTERAASGRSSFRLTNCRSGAPRDCGYRTRVNGETRQSDNTANMIFSVGETLSYISRGITFSPGDVRCDGHRRPASGSCPHGPPKWLRPGDVVEVEIEGIGVLRESHHRR